MQAFVLAEREELILMHHHHMIEGEQKQGSSEIGCFVVCVFECVVGDLNFLFTRHVFSHEFAD